MQIGIGMRLAGLSAAPAWTPAANWPDASSPGFWLDPTVFAGVFQDSAGTSPATAVEQPAGLVLDISGRGNHFPQATSTSRPIIRVAGGVQSLAFDGLDDGLSTGPITLGANMDCFIAVRRNSGPNFVPLVNVNETPGGFTPFFAAWSASDTTAAARFCGANVTHWVNGVQVAGGTTTNSMQLYDAVPVGQWVVLEVRNLDLSAWPSLRLGGWGYGAGAFNGGIAQFLAATAGDEAMRAKNRRFVGAKVGIAL